jgi:hypothetical protein
MTITCKDRERIFLEGTATEWAALEAHAATCAKCGDEVRAWRALSTAAMELRDYDESPSLWPRIARTLEKQGKQTSPRSERAESWWKLFRFSAGWQTAGALALVALLTVSAFWIAQRGAVKGPFQDHQALLHNSAIEEVEHAQAAYQQAIDKLDAQARQQLAHAETPLMASYREKLQLLNSAIGELQAQAQQNPGNAHLRRQLLAMYQEKQDTLEQVLEAQPQGLERERR